MMLVGAGALPIPFRSGWDHEFESAFLQRRVHCEPDAVAPHVIAGAGTLFSDQLDDQLFVG
jgi:hypothetical protein